MGNAVLILGLKPTGVRILVIFQLRAMFSHINKKLASKPFE